MFARRFLRKDLKDLLFNDCVTLFCLAGIVNGRCEATASICAVDNRQRGML